MTSQEAFERVFGVRFGSENLKSWNGSGYYLSEIDSAYQGWQAAQADQAATIAQLQAQIEIMQEALEHLAKLGNGPLYGTSEGNIIAKIALVRAGRVGDE